MALKPLHNPADRTMKIIGLMSGSGTNLRKIIEHQELLKQREGEYLFQMVAIFSDSSASKAPEIGKDFDIPVIIHDLPSFYKKRNAPRSDLKLREEFDSETVKMLSVFGARLRLSEGI